MPHLSTLKSLQDKMLRIKPRAGHAQLARRLVQAGFALTCVLVGAQFVRFVTAAQEGSLPLPVRPPGVEGFLPISGLMGLVDWIRQGALNTVHPAATVLLLIAVALSWLLRKSFCSWVCPVGLISELLAVSGIKLYGRNFRIWGPLDFLLRGLKYLLLGFFLWSILAMHEMALRAFLESPYNKVADIKMGLFFVRASGVTLVVMGVLVLSSMLVSGAWCRYLCPYGALLGLFSWISPSRVTRDLKSCVDCGGCDKVCMSRIPVSAVQSVTSPDCTGCLDCVAACPVSDCLTVKVARRRVPQWAFAATVLVIFLGGVLAARVTGHWKNSIDDTEYVERMRSIDSPLYGHPGRGAHPEQARGHPASPHDSR